MAGKSAYLENAILKHIFGIDAYAAPADLYFALFKGDPEDTGVEVSGGSYARVGVTNDNTEWDDAANVVENLNDIDFGTATADWAPNPTPATHIAIFDDPTAGNMLFSAEMAVPRIIVNGDPFKILAGQCQFTEA